MASRPWLLTIAGNRILRLCAFVTLASLIGIASAEFFVSGDTLRLGSNGGQVLLFWAIFVGTALAIGAQALLWISMLWFSIKYVQFPTRVFLIMFQLLGLSVAALLVYGTAYSRHYKLQNRPA